MEGVTNTTLETGEGTKISITPGLDTDGIYIGLGPPNFQSNKNKCALNKRTIKASCS